MIDSIQWPNVAGDRPPFERGGRPLRVTIYCQNRAALSDDETFALSLLRELAHFDALRVVDTDPTAPWRLVVDPRPNAHGVASVVLVGPGDRRVSEGIHPHDWIHDAISLLRGGSSNDARTIALASHLPIFEAHRQTYRDVFVTTEHELLQLRSRIPLANIRDVSEGLKIVGLSAVDWRVPRSRFGRREISNRSRSLLLGPLSTSPACDVDVLCCVRKTWPSRQ
jgi:hypothetical protein